jgi:hypothetical protein
VYGFQNALSHLVNARFPKHLHDRQAGKSSSCTSFIPDCIANLEAVLDSSGLVAGFSA